MSETPELVDLSVIFPSLHIDLKYATTDNITGAPIYREARCLLHSDAVAGLAKSISTIVPMPGILLCPRKRSVTDCCSTPLCLAAVLSG